MILPFILLSFRIFPGGSSRSPLPKKMAPAQRSKGQSKAQRKRSVYVLARPIKAAGKLSFLSEGKFPFCHWALLVSSHSESELQRRCLMLNTPDSDNRTLINASWGTLFELFRTHDGQNLSHMITEFGATNLMSDWSYACIAYVGKTKYTDYRLCKEGNLLDLLLELMSS